MRTIATMLLSGAFLGAAISDGWCPQPANLGAPVGSYSGATGAAPLITPPPPAPIPWQFDPHNPENMTRSERLPMVGRLIAAGSLKNKQEINNFLATGNPAKSWTPPPQKPLVKPSNMSDAQWQKFQAEHPRSKPPDYVRGTPITPLLLPGDLPRTMEQNAKAQGGTLTDLPGAVPIPPPPPVKTTSTTPGAPTPGKPASTGNLSTGAATLEWLDKNNKPGRYKPVTKLGVHPTQAQPAVRSSSSAAIDRLGSHGATGGSRTTMRAGGAALEKAKSPVPVTSAMDRLGGGPSHGVSYGAPGGSKSSNARASAATMKDPGRAAQQTMQRNFVTPPGSRTPADTFRQPR